MPTARNAFPKSLFGVAIAAREAGLYVIPIRPDGTKRPALEWKPFKSEMVDVEVIRDWAETGDYEGVAVICGAISGNLEMLELEGRAIADGIWDELLDAAAELGLLDLVVRLREGYMETSPSGGIHFLYRCDVIEGNQKLARRPAAETEDNLGGKAPRQLEVLIETRGEGGYTIIAPSSGRTHLLGRAWKLISGGLLTIPTITPAERESLFGLAAPFDECSSPNGGAVEGDGRARV
jgi:putative DNA primase/helicase